MGLGLHNLQIQIATRGIQLLKVCVHMDTHTHTLGSL